MMNTSALDINFKLNSDWGDGFSSKISIANKGKQELEDWILKFEFPYEITKIWNAEIVSRVGNQYTIRHASWNSNISPGANASFGFIANPGNVTTKPSNYILNGEVIGTPSSLPTPQPTPQISVGDVSVIEGDDSVAQFKVKLSEASDKTVEVKYSTLGETAVAGKDFRGVSGQLKFDPGETEKIVSVKLKGDRQVEADETFTLKLSQPKNAEIAEAEGVATIIDDDQSSTKPLPQLSIEDFSFQEGDSGSTNQQISVKLSEASNEKISLNYTTANGTAKAGSDYTATSGTLTFEPGETTGTIEVPVSGDNKVEADETFTLKLTNPKNVTIGDSQVKITILNDDTNSPPPVDSNPGNQGNTGNNPTQIEPGKTYSGEGTFYGATGAGHCSFNATPNNRMVAAMNAVQYNKSQACGAYVEVSGPKQEAGADPVVVRITDECPECQPGDIDLSTEAFKLIANPVDGRVPISWNLVNPNLTSPIIYHFKEGSNPYWTAVQIRNHNTPIASVEFQKDNGQWEAMERKPYNYFVEPTGVGSGPITLRVTDINGETITDSGINPIAGNEVSSSEQFPLDGEVADTPSLPPIPQPTPQIPQLSVEDVSVIEGDRGSNGVAQFMVQLSEASDKKVWVKYSTLGETAVAGKDFRKASGRLKFDPGETEKIVSVKLKGDRQVEADETFTLELSKPKNAEIAEAVGVATIIDDDQSSTSPLPKISIGDFSFQEGDSGSTNQQISVKLSEASNKEISLKYKTANGTAKAGSDYTATSGTLTFEPGETTGTIEVPVSGDKEVEADETFTLKLTNPKNVTIGDSQVKITILNDDTDSPPPTDKPFTPPKPGTGAFNYGEALQKSYLFYEAQRSGKLPEDNRISWRGDSALEDGADVGRDLSGGYYDAGDHVKFGLPMAASMTMLSWGVNQYRSAYKQSGQLDEALEAIKWGTDYILKAYDSKNDNNPGNDVFWGQVGSGNTDHAYWGSPENMNMERPSFKIDAQNPGSDLAGEAAAALAAASIAFRPTDKAYADKLLENAERLYNFADTYRGKYSDSITDARNFYNSWSGYNDELGWGASWLHKAIEATGKKDTFYLNKAKSLYQGINQGWTQNWDDKSYGTGILLAQETGESTYRNDVEKWLNHWTDKSGAGITYTKGGLAWLNQWGSLRYTANTAFLAAVYSDTVNDANGRYTDFVREQMDYILGDNPNKFSYLVGFGDNFPLNPHHRAASGTNDAGAPQPNRHTLYGALVGGPSSPNDDAYQDDRTDFIANEVALDYNAGFTGALAALYDDFGGKPLGDAELMVHINSNNQTF
ncbi:MAG: hypothetical protein F6K16_06050 [Symploca sp. SIO2B6]|nr:hypothetical protein [Symploca sp. SIO2B6]